MRMAASIRESQVSDRFLVNTQVQSHALLRRGFGTSVPFIHVVLKPICVHCASEEVEDTGDSDSLPQYQDGNHLERISRLIFVQPDTSLIFLHSTVCVTIILSS